MWNPTSGTSKLQEVPLHLHQALLHPVVLLLHILALRQVLSLTNCELSYNVLLL